MHHLDCRGARCPLPIIHLAQEVSALHSGTLITLFSDDPATWPDLQAWARMREKKVRQIDGITFEVIV